MTIKYKEAGNGQFIKIFLGEDGEEISRTATFNESNKPKTMGAGLWVEMQGWVEIEGNEIEPQFTKEEQDQKELEETEAAKTAYIGLRLSEYPSVGDQLDYIYHNGIAAWKSDIIKPIKDKYPKPEEES